LNEFDFRGQKISISAIVEPENRYYVVRDGELARNLGVRVGRKFTQKEIETSAHRDLLHEALGDERLQYVHEGINPVFQSRSVTLAEQKQIDTFRNRIEGRIQELTRMYGRFETTASGYGFKFYSTAQGNGQVGLWVNGISSADSRRVDPVDSIEFDAFLDAVEFNQEDRAYETLLALVLKFDSHHAEARKGMIEVFTHFFVTKEFPSEGVRQNYLHFILRCGHIY
jgi:hypothetical protein